MTKIILLNDADKSFEVNTSTPYNIQASQCGSVAAGCFESDGKVGNSTKAEVDCTLQKIGRQLGLLTISIAFGPWMEIIISYGD